MSESLIHTAHSHPPQIGGSTSVTVDTFSETHCLFCTHTSPTLEHNLTHMSKHHGLRVETANLLVDISSLLQYFHLVIAEECLYCGTHRHSRQAVQQHMLAKGHCKYDVSDEEFVEFYDIPEPERQIVNGTAVEGRSSAKHRSHTKDDHDISAASDGDDNDMKPPTTRKKDRAEIRNAAPSTASATSETRSSSPPTNLAHLSPPNNSNTAGTTLAHLPPAQQRAILATQSRQLATIQRTEKAQRLRMETKQNFSGRLGSMRLKRVPPHFGCVGSLNR